MKEPWECVLWGGLAASILIMVTMLLSAIIYGSGSERYDSREIGRKKPKAGSAKRRDD
jgi:hypothetical protein